VRVDQVIPALAGRDAVGNHTIALRDALRANGIESDIYAGWRGDDVAAEGRPMADLGRPAPRRWLLYQSSIGSPVFDAVLARPEPKLLNYHNITPARLLAPWAPDVAHEAWVGRVQLSRLAPHTRLAVADSRFNEAELIAAGYATTAVVPLLIDMTTAGADADPETMDALASARAHAGGGADLLFVGKVSPHKAPHDLVKMLHALRRSFDPRARLHLVGTPLSARYLDALVAYVERLGLERAVHLTGSVPPEVLEAYYRSADVFVCASEHEGFCVPLIEAMGHGVPVVAYGSSAVPETVGTGGLVLGSKDPATFAAAVARVLEDGALRALLAAGAAERVATFAKDRSARRFVDLISAVLAG